MLTQRELKTILDYDSETGDFFWRDYPLPSGKARRKYGRACIGSRAGHTRKVGGYLELRYDGKLYLGHRLAWLYIHGEWPVGEIDHIDGNPSNNAIANLRLATRAQQNANTKLRRSNKTGLKGVCRYGNRYYAYIGAGAGKTKYIGSFLTAQEAHTAYLKEALDLYGEFARAA